MVFLEGPVLKIMSRFDKDPSLQVEWARGNVKMTHPEIVVRSDIVTTGIWVPHRDDTERKISGYPVDHQQIDHDCAAWRDPDV